VNRKDAKYAKEKKGNLNHEDTKFTKEHERETKLKRGETERTEEHRGNFNPEALRNRGTEEKQSMDEATARRLNGINRAFYEATASEFHATRGAAWRGWQRVLQFVEKGSKFGVLSSEQRQGNKLSVLDVGCGNGRFGVFLAEQGKLPLEYHGLDSNGALLNFGRRDLGAFEGVATRLETFDLMDDALPDEQYDCVVLFGVMHHVPGAARRLALMRELARRVKAGGILAFACWRFYEYPRFRERIVAWGDDDNVEVHDYLLDWRQGERALRYCHYVDDAEHAALVAAAGLREVDTYRADGESGNANRYSILQP
jgi:tRNA (uracil-5-)-methyltransferase TRM9